MSIAVNIRKLDAWQDDLADQIRVEKLNEVAEDYASEITHELGRLTCPAHPHQQSYITIVAHRTNFIVIEKQFCCTEFEKKINAKIGR